ncbi:hypothetical protein P43SY_000404 [Pythium insidiosum]|uniref:tRNA threonylcarbamoyladenosine biosynthesis protein TsaE n=1 Tax=Pythium insidiosum TaxID=114742 RepID=A0AAD5LMJ2_PYTIN|nr:hypothetical protein P43SY_000404 [Pythium insidiosum]
MSSVVVRSQEEMEALGARIARGRRPGDVLFLKGDLGCGKTCFARGFIRAITGDKRLQVTSPTYLLVNTYEFASTACDSTIHHIDLYRLDTVTDVDVTALGLGDAFTKSIALVEWPQRLATTSIPLNRLEVHIEYDSEDGDQHPSGGFWVFFADVTLCHQCENLPVVARKLD